MSVIPLDFQEGAKSGGPQDSPDRTCRPRLNVSLKGRQELAAPGKAKRKTRRVKATGLRPAPAV